MAVLDGVVNGSLKILLYLDTQEVTDTKETVPVTCRECAMLVFLSETLTISVCC